MSSVLQIIVCPFVFFLLTICFHIFIFFFKTFSTIYKIYRSIACYNLNMITSDSTVISIFNHNIRFQFQHCIYNWYTLHLLYIYLCFIYFTILSVLQQTTTANVPRHHQPSRQLPYQKLIIVRCRCCISTCTTYFHLSISNIKLS